MSEKDREDEEEELFCAPIVYGKKIEFDLTSNCKTTIKRSSIPELTKRAGGRRPGPMKLWTYGAAGGSLDDGAGAEKSLLVAFTRRRPVLIRFRR